MAYTVCPAPHELYVSRHHISVILATMELPIVVLYTLAEWHLDDVSLTIDINFQYLW